MAAVRRGRRSRLGRGGLKLSLDSEGGGASGEVHGVGATPSLLGVVVGAVVAGLARVARVVGAARLASGGVEAVGGIVGGAAGALVVAGTASLSAGAAGLAGLLVGLVASGIAAHQTLAGKGHDSQAVRLGLGGGIGSGGQEDRGGDSIEEHLVGLWMLCSVKRRW